MPSAEAQFEAEWNASADLAIGSVIEALIDVGNGETWVKGRVFDTTEAPERYGIC